MSLSLLCPYCHEPLTRADDNEDLTAITQCPRCGQSVFPSEIRSRTALTSSISPNIPATVHDHESRILVEEVADLSLAEPGSNPPSRSLRRIFVVLLMIVVLLTLSLSIPGYRFVRDRYNPWLTEENWKRIQSNMTLEEVEAIFSEGKPCSLEDVKAAVDPIKDFHHQILRMSAPWMEPPTPNMPPFVQQFFPAPQNGAAERESLAAKEDDVAWQAKRQKAASWYRWRRGDTRLFVGVSTESKVRMACRITESSEAQKAGISWVYSVYPFADMELIERTGTSVEATLPEEKHVQDYIRSKSADPASIEINRWGPHDLRGEILTVPGYALVGELRRLPVAKVRVRYWMNDPEGKPHLNDKLYYIQNGEIFGSYDTPFGNRWFDTLRNVERQMNLHR